MSGWQPEPAGVVYLIAAIGGLIWHVYAGMLIWALYKPSRVLWSCVVSWDQRFDPEIPLPRGKPLATLRDAGAFISRLPKTEHAVREWQTAVHCLIEAAELRGPMMFARLGLMQALNRGVEKVFDPSRKDSHWGRRALARDR